jgi:cobalt-zinc-cadmium efflux system outer membrane protein
MRRARDNTIASFPCWAAVVALALGGCTTPHYDPPPPAPLVRVGPPVALPASDSTPRGTEPAEVVPAAFIPPRSPVPEARPEPVRLTVDQVINAVLVGDPKLRSGFEAINQASAGALTASLPPNPTLFTDAQLLPLTRPFTVDDQGGPPQQDVQITYPIDWFVFGKRAANMAAANLGVRVSEADYADLIRLRVVETTNTYYDVLEAKGLLELARQDVANLLRVEAVIEKGVAAGGKPRVDLDRIRLDLLAARRAAREAETPLIAAKAKLRAMLGRTDADPDFDVDDPRFEAPPTAAPLPVEEAFALAVRNRPDVRSRRWKVSQARADSLVQKRAAFPQVSPMFGYTHQYQRKAIGFPDADSWTASLTVTLPLFDRNQGNRARASSVLAQSEFDLAADLAALRAEVETAVQELRVARANAEAVAAEQLRLARDVLESITKSYEAGGRSLVDVLDAQRNFRETYRAYISSRATYWREVYQFGSVIGQQILHR